VVILAKNIAIVLPGSLLPKVRQKLPQNVIIIDAALEKAAKKVKQLEKQGIEVIISRGGTAQSIRKVATVPVVAAEATSFDVLETLWNIKKEFLSVYNIGLINFGNTRYDITKMGNILNLTVDQFNYRSNDLYSCVKNAVEKGMRILVGGTLTVKYAQEMGAIGVLQQIGQETLSQAVNKSNEIIAIRRQDRAKAERLRAILNFIHEGVIALDSDGNVTLFNPAAEKILNIRADEVIGKSFIKVFPELSWYDVKKEESYGFDQLVTVRNTQIVSNRIPIKINQKIVGGVTTFQKLDNIQKTEQKIRKELANSGLVARYKFADIIGQSSTIKKLIKMANLYAQADSTILITGESGTGKEIFAQSIHQHSARRKEPFVAINCAALPEPLLESELFGYEEGAFTGARRGGKQGMFELAHNGTIFLDEIGDMPVSLQARLLRVLQQKEVMRVGGEKVIPVNVRIIVATNQNLYQAVEQGKFREDLYYRINVLNLRLPSLRERREDIPLLFKHFIDKYKRVYNKAIAEIPELIIQKLKNYDWPGNIRELTSFAERFVILSGEVDSEWDLVDDILLRNRSNETTSIGESNDGLAVRVRVGKLSDMHDDIIRQVYELTGKNKNKTAKLLDISRTTVWKKTGNFN